MHLDGRSLPDGHELQTDVCIVGSGAAGITVARELSGTPFRVALVESGAFQVDTRTQALYGAENVGMPYFQLDLCRLRLFGGSTHHWHGLCGRLAPVDFEPRAWIPESGWPFGAEELAPYYERAQALVGLEELSFEIASWEDPIKRPSFGLSEFEESVNIYAGPVNFGVEYRSDVASSDNVTLVTHANVIEFLTNEAGTAVSSARAACLDGPRFSIRARHYVLAAGGIENARLLLLSRSRHREGLGNGHGLVGRYFGEHPMVTAGTCVPSDPYLRAELYSLPTVGGRMGQVVLTPSERAQRREQLAHCSVILVPETEELVGLHQTARRSRDEIAEAIEADPPDEFEGHLRAVLEDLDQLLRAYDRRTRRTGRLPRRYERFSLVCRWDQIPNPDSRVRLSSERDELGQHQVQLDWRIAPDDKRSVRRSLELLADELGRSGLGRARIRLDDDDASWSPPHDVRPNVLGSNHHMGTTRMHRDPKRGVVDGQGRLHETRNLWVAGSSVFPTYGHAPPTLTILALAIRTAEGLRKELAG